MQSLDSSDTHFVTLGHITQMSWACTVSVYEGLESKPGKGLSDRRTPLATAGWLGRRDEACTAKELLDRDLFCVQCCSQRPREIWQQADVLLCILHGITCL